MKIYEIGGRKVWLDKAPEGYEEPKKPEPVVKVEPKAEEPKPKAKAKKIPQNKSRKEVKNK